MKQSSKRLFSVFLAFVFIVAAIVLFFDLVQPEYNTAKSLQAKQLGEQSYLASQTSLVKQVQTTLNGYQNNAQNAANVTLAMPSGEDVAGALAQIQGIAANTGVTVSSISASPPQIQITRTPSGGTLSSSTALMKPLGSFTFNISASGSYESFKNFLQAVETNIRIFNVQAVTLQPASAPTLASGKSAASQNLFNYTITVATYYQMQ